MHVPPHPHTGLQTVTWLVEGEILHTDSLGSVQPVRPGQLNLMSAGHGIAHAEVSPAGHGPLLHGAQLWIALPDDVRRSPPWFEHHPELPVIEDDGGRRVVIVGAHGAARSPATVHSPIVAVEVTVPARPALQLMLDRSFEHVVVPLSGALDVEGVRVGAGTSAFLEPGRATLHYSTPEDARFLLLGGAPFGEDLVMWWNFVGRSGDEIERARSDWESGTRFGTVTAYDGARTAAPPLPPGRMVPRGSSKGPTPAPAAGS